MKIKQYTIGSMRGFNAVKTHYTESFFPLLVNHSSTFTPEKMTFKMCLKYNDNWYTLVFNYDGELNWSYDIWHYNCHFILNPSSNYELIKEDSFSFDDDWLNISTDILNFVVSSNPTTPHPQNQE